MSNGHRIEKKREKIMLINVNLNDYVVAPEGRIIQVGDLFAVTGQITRTDGKVLQKYENQLFNSDPQSDVEKASPNIKALIDGALGMKVGGKKILDFFSPPPPKRMEYIKNLKCDIEITEIRIKRS